MRSSRTEDLVGQASLWDFISSCVEAAFDKADQSPEVLYGLVRSSSMKYRAVLLMTNLRIVLSALGLYRRDTDPQRLRRVQHCSTALCAQTRPGTQARS